MFIPVSRIPAINPSPSAMSPPGVLVPPQIVSAPKNPGLTSCSFARVHWEIRPHSG